MSYGEIADDARLGILTAVINLVSEHKTQNHFHLSEDKKLAEEDNTFIGKILELNPRHANLQ